MSHPDRDTERDLAAQLRLRPERPRVTRLSRKVLIGLATAGTASIFGLGFWALQSGRGKPESQELYNTDSRNTADGLGNLPRDYTGFLRRVPALGPPLPGDLGRPILNAQQQGKSVPLPAPMPDPTQQRIAQEEEAARTSKLFSGTSAREAPSIPPVTPVSASSARAAAEAPPIDPDSLQNMQDRKLDFMNGPVDRKTVSSDRLENPASPYVLQAGSVIPAALITGIRSDLPGQVTAQVTETVYDSPSGRFLLIPQGAKLIGIYDSQVAFGQNRVELVWTRLIMPNGKSIVLERQPGADTEGYSGLEDEVDNHWTQLFEAALLSSLLGVGTQIGSGNNDNSIVQALRQGPSDTLNQTGQQIVRRNLNIQPTLTVRPGFPVRVIVKRDLVLAPYQS